MKKEKKMSWYDVTLGQFLKLQELFKIEDNNERIISIAELLLGNEISDLPLSEFSEKIKVLDFLKEPIPEKIPIKKIEVNGRKYFMDCLLGNITTAQYLDYINLAKTNELCKMMGVFLIPEGHKYNDGYDMEQVFNDINDLPVPVINDAAFFFERQLQLFIQIFLRYSTKKIDKMKVNKEVKKELKEVLNKSMDMALSPLYLNSVK